MHKVTILRLWGQALEHFVYTVIFVGSLFIDLITRESGNWTWRSISKAPKTFHVNSYW